MVSAWQHIDWFWGDDRFVNYSDPCSNFGVVRLLLLDCAPAASPHEVVTEMSCGFVRQSGPHCGRDFEIWSAVV
jgi:hypothetical protein